LYAAGEHQIAIDPQLAEFFVRDAEKALRVINTIYANNCRRADDVSVFIINIHAMKSALANVGESELSQKAAKLEQAGRANDVKMILSMLPKFIDSLKAVIEKNKTYEEGTGDETNVENNDLSYLKEKLTVIQTACDSLDKKTAKDALADLKEKTWSKATRDKLSVITEHLLHSEFEEAAAAARELTP
jgi:HPt (histidine-containing phosphotransfer) domain-containing protein